MEYSFKITVGLLAGSLSLVAALLSCSEEAANPGAPALVVVEPTSLSRTTACNRPISNSLIEVDSRGGDGTVTFTAAKSATWLALINPSGTTPDTIVVSFGVGGLNVGVYVDTIVITSEQADNSPQFVKVTLTIGSEMKISPRALNFQGLSLGGNPRSQQFALTDTCGAVFSYTLSESSLWLTLSRDSGTAPDTITVNVDITDLPTGIYTEIITIDAPQAANSPQEVICSLAVSSWLPQTNPETYDLQGVTFVDENRGWAVGIIESSENDTSGYILATTDGGRLWSSQLFPAPEALGDVAFVDVNTGWAVGTGGYIMHTTDGGLNWVEQNSGTTLALWGVTFIDANTGWAVGVDGIILHTTDGGAHWVQQFGDPDIELSAVAFVDSQHGWVVGNAGTILRTSDGGGAWVDQTLAPPIRPNLRDVYFSDTATGWVVGTGGVILHTTNGGIAWTDQSIGSPQLNGLAFLNTGQGWAVGEKGTILHTADGSNWVGQVSGTNLDLSDVYFIDKQMGWVVGNRGVILHTESGGN